jgi:hypothetical protein
LLTFCWRWKLDAKDMEEVGDCEEQRSDKRSGNLFKSGSEIAAWYSSFHGWVVRPLPWLIIMGIPSTDAQFSVINAAGSIQYFL